MADQLDNRPLFTIVMGCNGCGKSAWKRENRDRLPERYYDQDSIAGGIGDWDSEIARKRTREIVDAEIDADIAARRNFGIESTYSGLPGPSMVDRVRKAGYRVEGVYIGTESPRINIERVQHRVEDFTGHHVPAEQIPQRHGFSLSNLRKTAEKFDELEIVDNSEHDRGWRPKPKDQLRLENGKILWRAEPLEEWCAKWLSRFERALASRTSQTKTQAGGTGDGTNGGGEEPPPPVPDENQQQAEPGTALRNNEGHAAAHCVRP